MKYWQTASALIRRPEIRQEALSEKEKKLKIEMDCRDRNDIKFKK
jgi:hypothetical protein